MIMRFILVLLICSFFPMASFGEQTNGKTILLLSGEWDPFASEDAEHYGYYAHIVTEAFHLVGVKTKYEFYPWKRTEKYIEERKQWDGAVPYAVTPEREKLFYFSTPISRSCTVMFHLKSYDFNWQTDADLEGHIFGGTGGYKTLRKLKQIKKAGKKIAIQIVPNDLQNLKMLLKNRIDLFPCNREVGLSLIRKNFSQKEAELLAYHPKPFHCDPYHIIFPKSSKNSKRLIQLFNKGLKLLRKKGRYNELKQAFIKGEYD